MPPSIVSIEPESPADVLDCWFALENPGKQHDDLVRAQLGPLYERAAAGDLDAWAEDARERLALVLLLDQVPRHLYRRDARCYAMDRKAQTLTTRFIEREEHVALPPGERIYVLLPYLHAEDAERQAEVHPLIHRIAQETAGWAFMAEIADLYLDTIRRFGYFPHRNVLRGVPDTAEERRFLDETWYPTKRRVGEAARVARGVKEEAPADGS